MISSLTQSADFPQEYGENTQNQTNIAYPGSFTASPCQDVSEDCLVVKENPAMPAIASRIIQRYLVDTGCGYDLVSQRAIRQAMRQGTGKLIPSTHELTFHTGNGIAKSSK
eukprot:8409434-Karenia_brevis.AAC.1